jgi:hypothetical protein
MKKRKKGDGYQKQSTPHAENNYNDKDRTKKIIKIDLLNGERLRGHQERRG